ncbi:MAG: hypothetical protein H0U53_06650 [Actinobacteria bacterium]|nr:hypothetical protein [Actinomycetota bacterium]
MRTRLAILLALVLAFPLALALPAAAADHIVLSRVKGAGGDPSPLQEAAAEHLILAQEEGSEQGDPAGNGDPVGEEEGAEGGETNSEEGEGQSGADAETGVSEDEQTEPAEVEAGPVWTYQMSKIVIALLVLMALGIGAAYYKLVVQRQRAGI